MLQGPASTGAEGEAPVSAEIPPAIRALRARRRRRRKPGAAHGEPALQPQTPTETSDAARTGENSGGSGNTAAGQELPARPSRSRHRRRQRTGSGPPGIAERHPREDREPRREGRDARGRPGDRGPGGDRREGRRDGGSRDGRGGRPGRGRDAPPRKVERKLYQIDSVVDRGFEDVEEESGTRRVTWTILKRTTADQVSRKALSAVYVLQRDGADTEFPSLGAARNAVHKTIVHPEKLTRSKAEYAAEKK